jgi:hypothetical protein
VGRGKDVSIAGSVRTDAVLTPTSTVSWKIAFPVAPRKDLLLQPNAS